MNTSKEELIELVEFKSPIREKTKKNNKVALSNSITSLSTAASEEENIINIFSVTPRNRSKSKDAESDIHTVSEISDEVLVVKSEPVRAGTGKNDSSRTYREKISEHLRKIREKASTPSSSAGQRTSRSRAPVERVRRESENLDTEVENVRTKFKLDGNNEGRRNFFSFADEHHQFDHNINEQDHDPNQKTFFYALPEKMDFNMATSQNECLFVPDRSALEIDDKIGETQTIPKEKFMQGELKKIRLGDRNLLEKRLYAGEDKRWFDSSGNLAFLKNPVTTTSFKPNITTPERHLTSYKPATTEVECSEVVIVEHKILNLYLSQLKFTHHPLFSIEHVFAEKLKTLLETHYNREKAAYRLATHLAELRARRKQMNHGDSDQKLDKDIRKTREKYFGESLKQREDFKRILETWQAIKTLRNKQGFFSTNVKLAIKKEKVDHDAENESTARMLEDTFQELLRERQAEISNESDGENGESHGETTSIQDEDGIKQELIKRMEKTFKPPREPILKLLLSQNHPITETVDQIKENTRRNVVSSTKFYLRILCKDIEACKTKFIGPNENFSLDVDEIFSLQLTDIPKYLTVEVFEQPKSLLKKKVCELAVEVPGSKSSRKLHRREFVSNDIVHYKHGGVGSGVALKTLSEKASISLLNIPDTELKTSGYLEYFAEWEKTPRKEDVVLPSKLDLLKEIFDKNCCINEKKLSEFIESSNLEESCFAGTEFLPNRDNKCFRLNPHQKSLNFCNITEVEQNIRLKILWLRDQKEIEFDGMLIPNRIKEIPFSVLSEYRRRKAIEEKAESFEDELEDDVEAQRSSGRKYLRRVYLRTFQLCKNTDNNLDYESVVNEKHLVYFHLLVRTILRNFLNWFRWRPKINKPLPVREKKSEDETAEDTSRAKSNTYVSVKILGGKNIPSRSKNTFNEEESEENEVRPYVRIAYKNLTARTSASKGVNPLWNEILTVPLEAPNTDYLNPNSLDGSIVVDLFDESEIEIKKLNRKCTNWLGGLEISVSAICCSESMDGFFRVKLPYVLFGYETEEDKQKTKSPKVNSLQSCHHTYLQMEFSVQPNVPKLNPNMEELPCGDVPYIQEHIFKWSAAFKASHPDRRFSPLVLDTNGKTTCVTRFIKASEPPQINTEEFDVSAEQCLRYVSMIPFTDCNQFYNCVWLSTDQLINLMLGSVTDHAIALTCYLLALKMEVWLLLGYGIPHGNTAYVLVQEHNANNAVASYYILDVVYNEKYNVMDEYCPLQRIFCIINGTNVWGNTQKSDVVSLTRFDLSRRSDWLPLFNEDLPAPTNSISNKVRYRETGDTELMGMHMERQLKRQISKLRQLDRTVWNTGLSSVLANALKSFEISSMYSKNHFEAIMDLVNEISSYTVRGYAINVPFTSISSVVKKFKSLGIHVQQEEDIEFAAAVHLHSYPGLLLSVWIFLLSIKN